MYVVGRILDADGLPAPGVPVNVTIEGARVTGACFDSKPEVTGPRGDYEVCRHAHEISSGVRATVRAGGASQEVALDPDLRHAVALLRLPEPRAVRDVEGDIEFARHVRVTGRAYVLLLAPMDEEGVRVNATPMGGNVSVELRSGEGLLARANTSVTEHGRFLVDVPLETLPSDTVARVRVGIDVTEAPVDAAARRADVNVVRDLRLMSPGDDGPGSAQTGLPAAAALVGLAVAALTFGAASRRRSR